VNAPQAAPERYPALTGVRACGAIAVFLDHFSPWPQAHIVINVMAFFFVLSGFLITRLYHERATLRRAWFGRYALNRFARIYPVYFLLLTVWVCLSAPQNWWVLITNYTLTHALFHGTPHLIFVSWSLTVEECFYFSAPLFMILARRVPFAVVLLVMKLLHTARFVLSDTFFGHFAEFFAGMYLALKVTRMEARGDTGSDGQWCTLLGVLGVTLLVLVMAGFYHADRLTVAAVALINNFLIPVPIAILYLGLIRERSALAGLLSSSVARLLGRSSYCFYLLHALIFLTVRPLTPAHGVLRLLIITVTLIETWLLSIVLVHCYEEPLNVWIRRRSHALQGQLVRA
jgi:peptidoglycan/LPS O-acetylase OafA/YrhL